MVTKNNKFSLDEEIEKLTFFKGRTPTSTEEEMSGAFAILSEYRGDSGIYVGHYQGKSEWERHRVGDEIVMVISGMTNIIFLLDGKSIMS